MKEEDRREDIEEVKAGMVEVVVQDAGGWGTWVVTPWLRGEAVCAWGLIYANHLNVLTPPWVHAALGCRYPPDAPFFSAPNVAYVTLRWAFRRLFRHLIRDKGVGGGGGRRHTYGALCIFQRPLALLFQRT